MLTSPMSAPSRSCWPSASSTLRVSGPGCMRGALWGGLCSQGSAQPALPRPGHPPACVVESGSRSLAACALRGLLQHSAWQDGLPRWEWAVRGTVQDCVPLAAQGSLGASSLISADAQKFKTKFEECRKEIEEKEKKGAAGRSGLGGRALQTHSAPSCSPRRVLFLSATGTGGGAVISALLRAAQLPRYTGAFWGRASRVSPGLWGLGEVLVVPACSGLCYHRHPRHTLTWRLWGPAGCCASLSLCPCVPQGLARTTAPRR